MSNRSGVVLLALWFGLGLTACSGGLSTSRLSSSSAAKGGRQFGFIRSTNAKARTITFDQAEWLTGRAAQKAAEQDGVIAPGEPVPNDYYIRNRDKRTQVLRVAPNTTVRAAAPVTGVNVMPPKMCGYSTSCGSSYPMRLATFFAARPTNIRVWVTFRGGLVVSMLEQYVP